jgi:hypothetical protein
MHGTESRALAAVQAAEERFHMEQDGERLRLHRLRLQATVAAVSPLTRDLVEQKGCNLDTVAHCLRPTPERIPGMPHLHTFRQHLIPGRKDRPSLPAGAFVRSSDQRISRRIAMKGVILPEDAASQDLFGVVNDGSVLESAGWLGPYWFRTEGRVAHVLLSLPHTIIAVVPGMFVGDVVEHPSLSGRSYRIHRATSLGEGGGVVLTFSAGLIAHSLPWADELSAEMERLS